MQNNKQTKYEYVRILNNYEPNNNNGTLWKLDKINQQM